VLGETVPQRIIETDQFAIKKAYFEPTGPKKSLTEI
jgi:hypothetical protein